MLLHLSWTALAAAVGAAAPPFTLTSTDGTRVSLSDFAGKTVVLEWFNPDCPFVRYAHGGGPLATQPAEALAAGVSWLAINSGAPGRQGAGQERNAAARTEYRMAYPVLLDPDGTVGRAYGATSTPHMFVVDPRGTLVYAGAIDDAPQGRAPGATPTSYVQAALADLAAGRPVGTPQTKAYGCSVKYGG
jgi:peroxiredoxin